MRIINRQGAMLRAARAMLRMTVREVAESVRMSKNTISNLENGNTQPKDATLTDLTYFYESQGLRLDFEEGAVQMVPRGRVTWMW